MQSRTVARPVQLASPIQGAPDDDLRFRFNSEIIKEMKHVARLEKAKVAVISVAGAFRKGKSFLLNFFLRYLRALSTRNTRQWIRSAGPLDDGFHWRSGSDRDTTGIHIWSEPFFITKPNGEEVAVLLMDTQGTFDHQSTQQDCATIFAFSTLLSSVQIFNISGNIQETDLQYLRLFVEFAAMAKNSKEKVLQHLWFLLRDWQNPDEHEYGVQGGDSYLRKVLACDSGKPRENQELRQGIQRHFEKASCCLLPHPGQVVARSTFRGEVDKLDSEFVQMLEQFIPQVAAPQNLAVKKVNGKELTGKELFGFLEVYFEAFCGGKMLSPKNVFTATVEMANIAAVSEAKQLFEDCIKSFLDPTMNDDEFLEILYALETDALQSFDAKRMDPEGSETKATREKLCEELRGMHQRQNVLRQLQSERLSADQKCQMLNEQVQGLQKENISGLQKMQQMEAGFKQHMEDIRRSSISKQEMERRLQEESTRQATARRAMESRNDELCEKVNELASANRQLHGQLSQRQREQQQQVEKLMQQLTLEREQSEQRWQEAQGRQSGRKCSIM